MLKRTIPTAAHVMLPRTGHTINLEEPEAFNRAVRDFLGQVDRGTWGKRDPRSIGTAILGR
jgi:hypothetical protein